MVGAPWPHSIHFTYDGEDPNTNWLTMAQEMPITNLKVINVLVHKGDKWIEKDNIIECSAMTATKGE
jgi:hypothetical protein